MFKRVDALLSKEHPLSFIFCAGFEERVLRAPNLLKECGSTGSRVLILTYSAQRRHEHNERQIFAAAKSLAPESEVNVLNVSDYDGISRFIHRADDDEEVVIDITGLSRLAMMTVLSMVHDAGRKIALLYTEAEEYYPTRQDFARLTGGRESGEAFLKLSEYENAEILHSARCEVEQVPGLEGRILPNYPLMLIAFLTFKRARVSAVLQAYEANARILIKGVPVRPDLRWRADAIEIPNFDLFEDSKLELRELDTLSWIATYEFLESLFTSGNNRYRYNFIMAPLGSKMQTVGAWLFAKRRKEVRVVTSTPSELFELKYSKGFGETFFIENVCDPRNDQPVKRL